MLAFRPDQGDQYKNTQQGDEYKNFQVFVLTGPRNGLGIRYTNHCSSSLQIPRDNRRSSRTITCMELSSVTTMLSFFRYLLKNLPKAVLQLAFLCIVCLKIVAKSHSPGGCTEALLWLVTQARCWVRKDIALRVTGQLQSPEPWQVEHLEDSCSQQSECWG
nr:uncharacterized protein LOC105497905 isoform X2 [Macaca nemestrina]